MCRIEKKRTVVPALIEALENHKSTEINLNYFYQLLFTRENLKLVHIVCHKKGAHNLLCDTKKMFRKSSNTKKGTQEVKGKKRRVMWIMFSIPFFMRAYFIIQRNSESKNIVVHCSFTIIFWPQLFVFCMGIMIATFWTRVPCRALIQIGSGQLDRSNHTYLISWPAFMYLFVVVKQ